MTWDNGAALDALIALCAGIPGVQHVARGIPESFETHVQVAVGVGVPEFRLKVHHNVLTRVQPFLIWFGFRVQNDEGAAEDILASFLDAFPRAIYADRTLGGILDSCEIERTGPVDPDYEFTAGVEYRVCRLMVMAEQREQIPLTISP